MDGKLKILVMNQHYNNSSAVDSILRFHFLITHNEVPYDNLGMWQLRSPQYPHHPLTT